MPRPRILLDCDPGHDDAVAIMTAAHYAELVGITTVSGNVALELTTHNALITTQLLELDVPIHAGASRPLVAAPRHAEAIHGETGLGGPTLPTLTREAASREAVRFIIDSARRLDELWLVATGPLTNVALALREAPDIAERLAGVSIMGGGVGFGNTTPAAEFNILFDPEAADIVFSSGVKLYMCGLNLTHQFMIRPPELGRIREVGNRASAFVADMLAFYGERYAEKFFGRVEGPLHDPCAVLALTHPDLMTFESRHVVVELRGEHTRGMTLSDERGVSHAEPANAEVGYHIDAARAFEAVLEAIRAMP
jgi:inosine-uridine nucleoside N-ribohydrolase